MNTVQLYLQAQ